jgi:hypothetical protein
VVMGMAVARAILLSKPTKKTPLPRNGVWNIVRLSSSASSQLGKTFTVPEGWSQNDDSLTPDSILALVLTAIPLRATAESVQVRA